MAEMTPEDRTAPYCEKCERRLENDSRRASAQDTLTACSCASCSAPSA